MEDSNTNRSKLARVAAIGLILAACAAVPLVTSLGQKRSKEKPPKITGISSQKVASGEVISLSADGEINGTQSWQDPDGSFHLILPGSGESAVPNSPRGVNVRRVGNSLEIEVKAKRGSSVTVEQRSNRLDLVVSGGVESSASAASIEPGAGRTTLARREVVAPSSQPRSSNHIKSQIRTNEPTATAKPSVTGGPPVPTQQNITQTLPQSPAVVVQSPEPPPQTEAEIPVSDSSDQSSFSPLGFLSGWWVTLVVVIVVVFLLWRRHSQKSGWVNVEEEEQPSGDEFAPIEDHETVNAIVGDRRNVNRRNERRSGGQRSGDRQAPPHSTLGMGGSQGKSLETRSNVTVPAPATMYGAYRVDQEVGKLVLGQPHRMDVLASRGVDDRRAMEMALVKALRSQETDDDGRRKARQALEDYGFVARQSASVLLAQDPCERVAAARFLGEVGLPSSLQFLLEALYDTDTIVRTQAVQSIGALKLPSAIGALLDIARRYPDVSATALSSALNACSIECFDSFDSSSERPDFLLTGGGSLSSEITQLEPSATFYELPESTDDELLLVTLALIQSADPDVRAGAAQTLAIFRVQRSVSVLKELSSGDTEPAVRATAVASLGAIDHESVFSAVLVALADEARDVRAAAARAVSRLSFDRADAYARVIETSDATELTNVASACIKTGLAGQALERLASEDRRQAYEAFSLLSLLVRAGQCQPIFDVIEKHTDFKTSSAAIQLFSASDQPEVALKLKELAGRDGMPQALQTELGEAVSRIDQLQPV